MIMRPDCLNRAHSQVQGPSGHKSVFSAITTGRLAVSGRLRKSGHRAIGSSGHLNSNQIFWRPDLPTTDPQNRSTEGTFSPFAPYLNQTGADVRLKSCRAMAAGLI